MKKKNYKVKLKVKELLEERNITQKKLAQMSGIRESTVSDIVRGTRTVINFEHLSKIAEALEDMVEDGSWTAAKDTFTSQTKLTVSLNGDPKAIVSDAE